MSAADDVVARHYSELVEHLATFTNVSWTKDEAADALIDNPRIQEDYYNTIEELERAK